MLTAMADRTTERRWLEQLTALPTAPGHEDRVMAWAWSWVGRRSDLTARTDRHGNLLITQKGRKPKAPVVAAAHTDHPGFVVGANDGRRVEVEFRGGVRAPYFESARVELFDSEDRPHRGRLVEYDAETGAGVVRLDRAGPLTPGDIGRFAFSGRTGGKQEIHAPAHDDLAGVAAALAALDRARSRPALRHFGVLLTRAEEVGFVGAIAAARSGTLAPESRVLSIECSRSFADSPIGGGPIIRVGDASSVFDHALTNAISEAAGADGLRHQRKLMAGGSCEATAFVAYGYAAAGLCLPLGNYHNMGNLAEVEQGKGEAVPRAEVVSIDDFHGLVDLLLVAAEAVDGVSSLRERIERRFAAESWILE
jgi:putative aminopeptidase FrvX